MLIHKLKLTALALIFLGAVAGGAGFSPGHRDVGWKA